MRFLFLALLLAGCTPKPVDVDALNAADQKRLAEEAARIKAAP
jgi:hypothetical protein